MKKHDSKLTNPKDMIGSSKLPLDLVPDTLNVYAAMALLEGALKYGKYNWRAAGVRFSIYWSAFERHRMKLCSGEWMDPKTKVPHIASMVACLAIIIDAHVSGNITDDRPPVQPQLSALIDQQNELVSHLKGLFHDCHPHQHTINDATRHRVVRVRKVHSGRQSVSHKAGSKHDARRPRKAAR